MKRWWVHGDVRLDGKFYYCRRCDDDVAIEKFDAHRLTHRGEWPAGQHFARLRKLEAQSDFVLIERMLSVFERLQIAGTHFRPTNTRNLFLEGGGYGSFRPLG